LIGFRNRILVMIQWAWSYLTYQRGARLITGELRVSPVTTLELAEEARTSTKDMVTKIAETGSQSVEKRSA
jgi:hypothetical protein